MRTSKPRRDRGASTRGKSVRFPSFFSRSADTGRGARDAAGLRFEPLEPRLALAVVISEFLASNDRGITDFEGQHVDWIELHNTSESTENVAGWYLTDEALNRTQWQIPSHASTVLDPGAYLTIFASGKDGIYSDELHTNFRLSNVGEYLGLVMSNGTTVAYDFGAAYPEQYTDISYGTGVTDSSTSSETLVGDSTALTVISPTSENAARDDHWREIGFDDSGWLTGMGSVGLDRNSDGVNLDPYIDRELSMGEIDPNSTTNQYSAYVRYEFDATNKDQLTSLQLNMRFDDGFIGYLNDRELARANFAEDYVYTQPMWRSYSGHQQGTSSSSGNYNRAGESLDLVTWDLSAYLPYLVDEGNVLAFHAVTSRSTGAGDNLDLLIDPVLSAERATGGSQVGYMVAASPGRGNGVSTLGIVADTQFSHDRGFYDTAFDLAITTATAGATIRYTTDGSVPTLTNGVTYVDGTPISIDPATITSGERGVVMIRAAAFKTGYTPTNVDTQTYIFLDKVILQDGSGLPTYATWGTDGPDGGIETGFHLDTDEYDWEMDPDIVGGVHPTQEVIDALKAIPTVSIVMDWDDLWSGDAEPGTPPENWNGNGRTAFEPQGIYIHGRSDERPTSMEYFTADGNEEFQVDAVIEIQGHSSGGRWNSDKLSFQVKFKEPDGDPVLDYSLFTGTADGENATTQFDTLILDAGFNYIWNHTNPVQRGYARFVTDQVVADLQNLVNGNDAPHGKYVHLYLDGVYWGLYDLHERADEHFAADYFGGNNDDYFVVKHANQDVNHKYTWVHGGVAAENAYQTLLAATENAQNNPTSLSAYQAVTDILDVDQFIDYSIVHMYAGNENDWPHNNWYATFNHVDAHGNWRFHAWDQEHAFPTSDNGDGWDELSDPTDTGSEDAEGPGDLFHDLTVHEEFQLRFADRVEELMRNGGVLTESVAQSVYEARLTEIYDAMIAESARWGDNRVDADPHTQQDWIDVNIDDTTGDMMAVVPDFFPVRTNSVLGRFDSRGWLPSLDAPDFNQYGGEITSGFELVITNPNGSGIIYYTLDGTDPRDVGGAISGTATAYGGAIELTESTRVRARIRTSSTSWSAEVNKTFVIDEAFPLRIVELHYNPDNGDEHEFIELVNTGSTTIRLDGVQITDFTATPYVFDSGQTLGAGQRIVVARNPVDFTAYYGSGINLATGAGYADANLRNGGETISVLGPVGELVQRLTYDDAAPWVTAPDGTGPSLEYVGPLDADPADPNDIAGDPYDDATNWRASAAYGGSPGTSGSTTPLAGDYDGSGTVDDADYTQWVSDFGTVVTPGTGSDGSGNGLVDAADYTVWRDNYGATQGSGAAQDDIGDSIPVQQEPLLAIAAPIEQSTLRERSLLRQRERLHAIDESFRTNVHLHERDLLLRRDRDWQTIDVTIESSSPWLRRSGDEETVGDASARGEVLRDGLWQDDAWLRRLSL